MPPPPQDPRADPRFQGPPQHPGGSHPGSSSDQRPRLPEPRIGSGSEHPRAGGQELLRSGSGGEIFMRGAPPPDPRHIPSGQDHGRLLQSSGQDQRGLSDSNNAGPGLAGRRVGPYRITALIAQGGMGAVYEAIHERLQRAVALKTLLPGADSSNEDVQRFLNEARAAARLSHRNIVPIHDVGEHNGIKYLAMELVRGETVHALLRRTGPLEERRALEIVADAADGLEHAHENGIVHRDLKPANILLESDGTPRVTDFGVAKARGNQRLTATGTALGTPSYMSPEQAMGQNDSLDARTDVYGLGAILYECLTGRPPFDLGTHLLTMQAVVADPPVAPSEHRKGLSPEVEAICLKCLEKKREARYASCRELAEDLRRCLAGRTVAARPPSRLGLVVRRLRRFTGLVTIGAAVAGALLATLLGVVPGALSRRRVAALEASAEALARARLEQGEAALGREDLTLDDARALLAGLDPAAVRSSVTTELAPTGTGGGEEAAAVERGLARVDLGRGRGLQARAAVRLAAAPGADPITRDALLARAELLDPDGASGRAARADTASALVRVPDATASDQALVELASLARTLDPAGRTAAAVLTQGLADRGRWSEALAHATRLRTAGSPSPAVERLGALATLLTPAITLPPADLLAVARSPDGPLLVLSQGASVWTRRLRPDDGAEALARPADGGRQVEGNSTLRALLPFDRDGDGADELFVVLATGHMGVGRLTGTNANARWIDWTFGTSEAPHSIAAGNVDGDGLDDLVLAFWEGAEVSMLVLGRDHRQPIMFFGQDGRDRRYSISKVAFADLDGDGRDELVLGGSQFWPELEVFSWDPKRGALVPRARMPVGVVRDLVPYEVDGGPREGLVVVVDSGRDDADRLEADDSRPWHGRDGLYLLEGGDGEPALVGRWTYGPDDPPTTTSRVLADGVLGFCVSLAGRLHVGRAARVEDLGWTLELAPREELGLKANAAPALVTRLATPPAPGRLLVQDLDGDGAAEDELIIGQSIHGLGSPTVSDPFAKGAEAAAADAAAEDAASALLRVTRKLVALGRASAAEELVARLRAEHPGSWAASAAELALLEPLLRTALDAKDGASRAFARLDASEGERSREASRDAWLRAAEAHVTLAGSGRLAPSDRRAALERAAHAFEQGEDRTRAIATLERAALAVDGGAASPEVAQRLQARLELLRRAALVGRLEIDPARPEVRATLLASNPLRCVTAGSAVTIRCAPDTDDWAVFPIDVDATLPLAVEGTVKLHGHAWATYVDVGLFEPRATGGELVPERVMGIRVSLWDVATRRASVRGVVGTMVSGTNVRLKSFEEALTFRLELMPLDRGGMRARVRVTDSDGRLILVDEVNVDTLPGSALFAGLRSPTFPGQGESVVEQSLWSMESSVTLERLRIEGIRPRLTTVPDAIESAHAALTSDDAAPARRLYDHRLQRGATAEAFFFRGLARGRLGEADAYLDIVEAARRAPFQTILWLEDIADLLPQLNPGYATAVNAALVAMAASDKPIPQAIGRQLQGELDVVAERIAEDPASAPDPGAEAEVQEAAIYLSMRCAHNPQRWRLYQVFHRLVPWGRYPRKALPKMIVAPSSDPARDVAELDAMTRAAPSSLCLIDQFRLVRRVVGGPSADGGLLSLASFYANQGAYGMAEGVARDLLDRPHITAKTTAGGWMMIARTRAAWGDEAGMLESLRRARATGIYTASQIDEYEQTMRGLLGVVGPVLVDEAHRQR